MTRYVVDANVAIKLVVPEDDSDLAARFFRETRVEQRLAPHVIAAEFGYSLRRHVRIGTVSLPVVRTGIIELRKLVVFQAMTIDTELAAFDLSNSIDHSFYDCLYAALAAETEATLISADAIFLRKLAAFNPAFRSVHLQAFA